MTSLLLVFLSAAAFIAAYHTYGRWLARRVFRVDAAAVPPSKALEDGVDFVPTPKAVLFGHHFTSIAGTGPIVGPAIAILWGWLPAVLWVVFGSIFVGAVHDFGALMVSLRSRGQTIGEVAGRLVNPRVRVLFLLVLFFTLTVVVAIFGLVIATIFSIYPQTVLSVWAAMPLATLVGLWIYKRGGHLFFPSVFALVVLYVTVVLGVRYPVDLTAILGIPLLAGPDAGFFAGLNSAVVIWTVLLLAYCYLASVLPVWLLLQPRDYINSHQLFVALILLVGGIFAARPDMVAPLWNPDVAGAPPIMPFLFITIACGAISGFHCLVSSGTTSKQLRNERDAQFIGYGSMLTEGMLAVLVIVACAGGIGLHVSVNGQDFSGVEAWRQLYGVGWEKMQLRQTVGAFVEGASNLMSAVGVPRAVAVNIVAVMVACFAATTIDTATRLHRYVVQELGGAFGVDALRNKYAATAVAVAAGGTLALLPGPQGPGSGGLVIWPLFGATNQLLAGLALLVVAFYLRRSGRPCWFILAPLVLMIVLPFWALVHQIFLDFLPKGKWTLTGVGLCILALQCWMVVEAMVLWRGAKGADVPAGEGTEGAACCGK